MKLPTYEICELHIVSPEIKTKCVWLNIDTNCMVNFSTTEQQALQQKKLLASLNIDTNKEF